MALTGKTRAFRIQLDYYRKLDPMMRWKLTVAALVGLTAILWLGAGLLPGRMKTTYFSHGGLSASHAAWEAECSACHIETRGFVDALKATWKAEEVIPDSNCKSCHAGPEHHASQVDALVPRCASCHSEHEGFNADIARVEDQVCTSCHGDIAAHTTNRASVLQNVTSFTGDHPDFNLPSSDPGNLKFTHSRHLAAGLLLPAGNETAAMRWSDLADHDRRRYGRSDDSLAALVQLDCQHCHELDVLGAAAGDDAGAGIQVTPASGAYMLPISYERHCSACHPLDDPAANATIPHGLDDGAMDQFVKGIHLNRLLAGDDRTTPSIPSWIPGKLPIDETSAHTRALLNNVTKTKQHLRGVCQKCHHLDLSAGSWLSFVRTAVPANWFSESIPLDGDTNEIDRAVSQAAAVFDHSAHRAIKCTACHAGVGDVPKRDFESFDAQAIWESNEVYVPAEKTVCSQCHQPRHYQQDQLLGGARHDCVECHRYHGGDAPWHGAGSALRAPSRKLDVPTFLDGGRDAAANE